MNPEGERPRSLAVAASCQQPPTFFAFFVPSFPPLAATLERALAGALNEGESGAGRKKDIAWTFGNGRRYLSPRIKDKCGTGERIDVANGSRSSFSPARTSPRNIRAI